VGEKQISAISLSLSSIINGPCSITFTPFSTATRIESSVKAWAATLNRPANIHGQPAQAEGLRALSLLVRFPHSVHMSKITLGLQPLSDIDRTFRLSSDRHQTLSGIPGTSL
jgi:hypothetical protein